MATLKEALESGRRFRTAELIVRQRGSEYIYGPWHEAECDEADPSRESWYTKQVLADYQIEPEPCVHSPDLDKLMDLVWRKRFEIPMCLITNCKSCGITLKANWVVL